GLPLEQVKELHVPGRVVESGTLAVYLVREASGRDDGHLEILRVALDRPAERPAQPEAAPRCRDGEFEHADLQRDDRAGPSLLMRPQHRQRREAAVIEWLCLEVREIELVGGERRGDMAGEPWVALDRRQLARPAALIGHRVLLPHSEREVRVMVEEERGDVVVVDEEQDLRPLLLQPLLHRLVAREYR